MEAILAEKQKRRNEVTDSLEQVSIFFSNITIVFKFLYFQVSSKIPFGIYRCMSYFIEVL